MRKIRQHLKKGKNNFISMFIEFIINLKQFYPFPESPLKSSPVYSFLVAMVHPCYRKQTLYWF